MFEPAFRWLVSVCAILPWAHLHAQVFDLRPQVIFQTTYSDNLDASSDVQRSGWLTELSPSLNGGLNLSGGRGSATFDIGFRNIGYESGGGWRKPALSLQAVGEVEAIEDFVFVQANAAVQRSPVSPFQGRASGELSGASRANETRSITLAPRAEFSIGSFADARLEQRISKLSVGAGTLDSQTTYTSSFDLNGARAFGPLDWGFSYRRSLNDATGDSQKALNTTARLTLAYALTQQLGFRGIVGRELNRFGDQGNERTGITGLGVDWSPTSRTSISGTVEDRFFGNGYELTVSHRMARSSLQLSLGRDYSTTPASFESIYTDPEFSALFNSPNFREDIVDPALRERAVRDRLQYARDGLMTNAQFIDRRARVSYTLSGIRNTFSLSYSRSLRTSLSDGTGLTLDDVFRDASSVATETIFLGLDHRLSPKSGFNLSLSRTNANSTGVQAERSSRNSLSVGFDTRLGHRTLATLNYRRERLTGLQGFSENTFSASINMRF